MDSEEISKLYRVWNSLMKMIQDRDYNVPDELIARSQFNFKQILQENPKRSALNTEISRNNDPNSKIFIHFDDSPTVSVPIISSLAQKMNAEHVQRAILIGKSKISPSAQAAILQVKSYLIIEFFQEKELMDLYIERDSAQRHSVLNNDEKQEFLDRYQIQETQIPKMDVNDPIARHYGLQKGEIIKMIKNRETGGKFFTFRIGFLNI